MNSTIQKSKLTAGIAVVALLLVTACERRVDDIGAAGSSSNETASATSPATPSGTTTPPTVTDNTASNTTSPSTGSDTSGAGTTGSSATSKAATTIDDTAITAKVKMALLADSDIKGLDVSVETNNGNVMLSGFVNNQVQIERSVKIASAVEGVKDVSNKLEIKK